MMTCVNCEKTKGRMMTVMLPVGQREFCSDRCYGEYLGLDMDIVQGYYESQVMEDE